MAMKIEKSIFGTTKHGEPVSCYTIHTPDLRVKLLDYGATIQSLFVKDKSGDWVDVVLGYDTIREYEENDGYLGACIGRVGNRIGGAKFTLNGNTYSLYKNDGENHLHGGLCGFNSHVWQTEEVENGLRFSRVSPDGEEGYPGTLHVSATYLIHGSTLTLAYQAQSDADTLCNLTNHTYFNLSGKGTVLNHLLRINAERFLENDAGCLPTGRLLLVSNTPFDFRTEKEIGRDIGLDNIQLKNCGGIDHNFCLGGETAAQLYSKETGIEMTVTTTMPGVQVYSGNFLTDRAGKYGATCHKRDAICLETQYYPNAMACEAFEKPILRARDIYHHTTSFAFSIR